MSKFGSRLRHTMDQQGLTDAIMAAELGLNKRTYNHYINARAEPKFSTLCAISDTLGVNLHWLLTGEGPMDLPDIEFQLPPVILPPIPDPGAEPARTASRAGNLPEGARKSYQGQSKPIERARKDMSDHAPSGVSLGFADLEAAKDAARSRRLEQIRSCAPRRHCNRHVFAMVFGQLSGSLRHHDAEGRKLPRLR